MTLWLATEKLQAANEAFQSKTEQVSNLLNNSGQGFLSFGADRVIDTEYSRACETMLGESPSGRDVAEVFFHDDNARADLFCTITSSVQAESDPCICESMLSLLPTEIQRENALLKAEYKVLENGKFMVILTDITENRRMEGLLESERHRLEMIVMAVSDSRNFFDTSDAFCEFLADGLPSMLNETAVPQILAKALYREIHTYKGVLNQFSFPTIPTMLHDIETGLSGLLLLGDTLTRQKIAELVSPEILQTVFDNDLAILSEALGKEFLANRKKITLSDTQALQLEKLAKQLLHGETIDTSVALTLLNQIGTLRKLPLREVLMGFSVLVKQAAERVEKDVVPLEVIGGADVWIDPKPYKAFFRSLVHVFRNAVVHGLETPDGRWEAKKDEAGKITCSVVVEGNAIKLVIADDGAGINLDALRERAVATGIYGAGEVQNVPDEEIARLIFMDNISTQKEVTELAGRGVGLAAVLIETKNLGGEVLVKTVAGGGTQFLFNLPWLQEPLHNEVRS